MLVWVLSKDRLGGVGEFLQGVWCVTDQGREGSTLDLVCAAGWMLCGVDLVGCALWRQGWRRWRLFARD